MATDETCYGGTYVDFECDVCGPLDAPYGADMRAPLDSVADAVADALSGETDAYPSDDGAVVILRRIGETGPNVTRVHLSMAHDGVWAVHGDAGGDVGDMVSGDPDALELFARVALGLPTDSFGL